MRFLRSLATLSLLAIAHFGLTDAAIVSRQSIDTFFNTTTTPKETSDLFYLAMDRIMDNTITPYTDKKSWFALAAVHGNPVVYDNTPFTNRPSSGNNWGYCAHGDEIFPTWHRPYLSALENSIISAARDIINAIPISATFTEAQKTRGLTVADSLRLPYWDWEKLVPGQTKTTRLAQKLVIPAIFKASTVSITNWVPKSIKNPLLSYTLPASTTLGTSDVAGGISSTGGRTTNRGTTSTFYVDSLRDDISQVLSMTRWSQIAHHNVVGANIETIHDYLHGFVGGTMGSVPTAAFDPIFWFHHNNVDRVFAIYQATRTESTAWISSTVSTTTSQASLTYAVGSRVNATAPLFPFRWGTGAYDQVRAGMSMPGAATDFITSQQIRDVKQWSYTYPELAQIDKARATGGQTAVNTYVRTLFPLDTWKAPGSNGVNRRLLAATARVPDSVNWRVVFETFPVNYFGGSVEVRVFINLPSASAATSVDSENLAADIGTFSMRGASNKGRAVGASITNTIERLNLVSGTVTAPRVAFQNFQVVITGPTVAAWLSTATSAQLSQLRADIARDMFSPKIKEFAVYLDGDNEEQQRFIKRYIGVPVTISVAADGVAASVVSASVKTLEMDMSGIDEVDPNMVPASETTTTSTSTLNLPVVIGAAVGGVAIISIIIVAIVITRRRRAMKHTVSAIDMGYTNNPAIQQL